MNILGMQYSLTHRALEIYLAGCTGPHCPGCHNPESWDFAAGEPYDAANFRAKLQSKLVSAGTLIKHIWVLGGEPLDQPEDELRPFLQEICSYGKEVWLFTREDHDDVPAWADAYCDYVKTGRYIEGHPSVESHGITLASDNQKIWGPGPHKPEMMRMRKRV